jgi:hypothetical protein
MRIAGNIWRGGSLEGGKQQRFPERAPRPSFWRIVFFFLFSKNPKVNFNKQHLVFRGGLGLGTLGY